MTRIDCELFRLPPEPKIWVLLGDRSGNNSQSLGVAEALGLPFEVKPFAFNFLSRLPNAVVAHTTIGISAASLPQLAPPWPDMVIGAGRKLARIASYIKSKNPACYLVHIQWPGFSSAPFNLIASPLHDAVAPGKNIIMTIGAPHRVTQKMLDHEAELWRPALANYPAPKIALLVGGSSHNRRITAAQTQELATLSSAFASHSGGSLLITTSRRTTPEIVAVLKENLTCPYYLHEWREGGEANPYYGFLGLADAIIVTGDSVTMCSEACATGKPVFIYSAENFTSPKHREFHQALYERHLAKPLQGDAHMFTPPFRLDDAAAVASEIKKVLAQHAA